MSRDNQVTRRTALKALGAAGLVGAAGTGLSMASGGSSGDGSNSSSGSAGPSVSNYWTYSPENSSYGRANAVVNVDDGYAFAGHTHDANDDDNSENRMWLQKVGSDGTTEWSKTYGEKRGDASVLLSTDDGGYLLAGTVGTDGHVYKTDETGSVQWEQTLDGSDTTNGFDIYDVVRDADGYVFAGSRFVKLASDGSEMWSHDRAVQSVTKIDGGYALLSSPGLVKTDSKGDVESENDWDSDTGMGSPWFRDLTRTADGGFLAVGMVEAEGDDYTNPVATKATPNGDRVWTKRYDAPANGLDFANKEGAQELIRVDGGYVFAGSWNGDSDQFDAFLLKIGFDGTEKWRLSIDDDDLWQFGFGLAETDDGYAVAGLEWTKDTSAKKYHAFLAEVTVPGKKSTDGNNSENGSTGGDDQNDSDGDESDENTNGNDDGSDTAGGNEDGSDTGNDENGSQSGDDTDDGC